VLCVQLRPGSGQRTQLWAPIQTRKNMVSKGGGMELFELLPRKKKATSPEE